MLLYFWFFRSNHEENRWRRLISRVEFSMGLNSETLAIAKHSRWSGMVFGENPEVLDDERILSASLEINKQLQSSYVMISYNPLLILRFSLFFQLFINFLSSLFPSTILFMQKYKTFLFFVSSCGAPIKGLESRSLFFLQEKYVFCLVFSLQWKF